MEILEKVAYMKGLAEGLGLDTKTKEGKLLTVMMDVLDDIALELQDIRDEQEDLERGLDAVSDDLSDVESVVYDMCGDDDEDEDEEDEYDDEEETILADGEVQCPNCGEKLEFDLDDQGCCGRCGSCADDADEDEED